LCSRHTTFKWRAVAAGLGSNLSTVLESEVLKRFAGELFTW
jgi:hypothetical protein